MLPVRRNTGEGPTGSTNYPFYKQQRMVAALYQGMALSQIHPLQKEIADYNIENIFFYCNW